jgi:hypothetical protein
MRDRDLMRALRLLGAQAIRPLVGVPCEGLLPRDLLPDGLLIADGPDCAGEEGLMALPLVHSMEKLAGGERYWPPGTPVWRATGSRCPDKEAAEALYGANALGDAARYARLSRFVQAEAFRARALTNRRESRAFAVIATEDAPLLASPALIEHSGKTRPSYEALRQAWGDCAAFEIPEAFTVRLPLKVWIFSGNAAKRPAAVSASLFALDGTLLASVSFAAISGETSLLGELKATLPEEGIVIARAELSASGKTRRIDQAICLARPGTPARGTLLNPPRAELRIQNGELSVTGHAAALGVFAGSFYGALLPGEKIALPEGISAEDIESLNGQIL